MSDTPAPAASHLWTVLRAYLRQTCALFGEPSDLARGRFLTRLQHKHLCEWLRPLEALVRRLLYLMARTMQREPAPASEAKARPPREMKTAFGGAFDIDNSESWRVSFNLGSCTVGVPAGESCPPARRVGPTCAVSPTIAGENAGGPNDDCIAAAPVAMRLEAMIRVALDPAPYAEKLARRIADEEEPPHALLTVSRQHTSPLYTPVREAANLIARSFAAAPAFADSS